MKRLWTSPLVLFLCISSFSQTCYWQQRISYGIDVDMNVVTNRFTGIEKINYWNNSPDTLTRVFFHLYWNAFQPNSSMDVRSRELGNLVLRRDKNDNPIRDWDPRVRDRILNLKPEEIGCEKVAYVKLNGRTQKLKEHETILEVVLSQPILPKTKAAFEISFEAQVPLQVRRSGRDNAEGIRYSMSQWYPKMVEYDAQGWNANPYIAREFYGVWGDYDVNIRIDKSYVVAGTGTRQMTDDRLQTTHRKPQTTANTQVWHFKAPNVHDFVWAADTTYEVISRPVKNGPLLYAVYKKGNAATDAAWKRVIDTAELAYPIIAKNFGAYPYKNYSFIQGGDGGMEYPMATLMRSASIGTALHEWMHSWFQGMLATNESLYPWMDEGFTNYAEARVMAELHRDTAFAQEDNYEGYYNLVRSRLAEPLTTHADHYSTNYAYNINSYSKGAVFLEQLGYIIGDKVRDKVLLDYYRQWRFKHPTANDFIRVAEKVSGMELDWYKEYWVYTTKTIDYAIDSLWDEGGKTKIRIRRVGEMPMPIDVQLTFKDGTKELHYMPLNLMYGEKPAENTTTRYVHEEWRWTHPTYVFETSKKLLDLTEVAIDPTQRLADVDKRNNVLKIKW